MVNNKDLLLVKNLLTFRFVVAMVAMFCLIHCWEGFYSPVSNDTFPHTKNRFIGFMDISYVKEREEKHGKNMFLD